MKFVSTPLSAIGSVRDGGRYNPQGGFEVLYAADSEDTVLRETRAVVIDPNTGVAVPQRHPPRVHFTVNLDLQSMVTALEQKLAERILTERQVFALLEAVADQPRDHALIRCITAGCACRNW